MWTRIAAGMMLLGLVAALAGCETSAQTGALIGAGGGALAGQAIGGSTEGTLIGTAVGAGLGYIIGNEQDKARSQAEANTVVVNVHNSNGSITSIALRRVNGAWVGPRGEQYYSVPTEDQLRPLYGF